ncbi:MAG: VWA domain-containing protein [Alphaproteobacteria bacterium]
MHRSVVIVRKAVSVFVLAAAAVLAVIRPGVAGPSPDVVVLFDQSGSIKKYDPKQASKAWLLTFLKTFAGSYRISLVGFDEVIHEHFTVDSGKDVDLPSLAHAVDALTTRGKVTDLEMPFWYLLNVGDPPPKLALVITDGQPEIWDPKLRYFSHNVQKDPTYADLNARFRKLKASGMGRGELYRRLGTSFQERNLEIIDVHMPALSELFGDRLIIWDLSGNSPYLRRWAKAAGAQYMSMGDVETGAPDGLMRQAMRALQHRSSAVIREALPEDHEVRADMALADAGVGGAGAGVRLGDEVSRPETAETTAVPAQSPASDTPPETVSQPSSPITTTLSGTFSTPAAGTGVSDGASALEAASSEDEDFQWNPYIVVLVPLGLIGIALYFWWRQSRPPRRGESISAPSVSQGTVRWGDLGPSPVSGSSVFRDGKVSVRAKPVSGSLSPPPREKTGVIAPPAQEPVVPVPVASEPVAPEPVVSEPDVVETKPAVPVITEGVGVAPAADLPVVVEDRDTQVPSEVLPAPTDAMSERPTEVAKSGAEIDLIGEPQAPEVPRTPRPLPPSQFPPPDEIIKKGKRLPADLSAYLLDDHVNSALSDVEKLRQQLLTGCRDAIEMDRRFSFHVAVPDGCMTVFWIAEDGTEHQGKAINISMHGILFEGAEKPVSIARVTCPRMQLTLNVMSSRIVRQEPGRIAAVLVRFENDLDDWMRWVEIVGRVDETE